MKLRCRTVKSTTFYCLSMFRDNETNYALTSWGLNNLKPIPGDTFKAIVYVWTREITCGCESPQKSNHSVERIVLDGRAHETVRRTPERQLTEVDFTGLIASGPRDVARPSLSHSNTLGRGNCFSQHIVYSYIMFNARVQRRHPLREIILLVGVLDSVLLLKKEWGWFFYFLDMRICHSTWSNWGNIDSTPYRKRTDSLRLR